MAIQRSRILSAALLAGCALGYAGAVSGAGFAIIEHSAKGLGAAFSGGAASAEDTSTVWFNPAGMTKIPGTQIDAASHIIVPSSDFTNQGSTINPLLGGTPLSGGNSKDPGVAALVPNFYYVRELRPNLKFGLGVNAPFGLKTDYSQNWVGRYHALTSDLKTININPGLAYQFDSGLSLGVGVSAQYADARLTNAIDKSTACLGAAPGAVCGAFGLVTPATPTTDGYIDLKDADDWSYGYNVGALYEFSPQTRLGVHWRSKISHELEGKAEFTNTADLAAIFGGGAPGAFTNQTASAKVTMPESLSVSGYHQVNPKLGLMGDVTWTRWNRFDELIINFDGGHPQNVTPENWDNSIRLAGGATYAYNNHWTLRGGLAWDEEPIPDATHRTPRIPGDDRFWVAVGASYQRSDKLSFDIGYTHLFVGDVPINNTEVNTGHVLIGEYDADVNIFSAQVNYRFR